MKVSWKDAILSVAKEMLEEVEDLKDLPDPGSAYCRSSLKGYARTLKAICESAGDPTPPTPSPSIPVMMPFGNPYGPSPDLQNHLEIEKARGEFRKAKGNVSIEERHGGDGVFASGGPADGTFVVINPDMPLGARDIFAGGVYELVQVEKEGTDPVRRLEYDEQQTLLILSKKGGD